MRRKPLTLADLDRDLRAFNCMDRIPEIKVGKYSYSDIRFNTIGSDVVVFYSGALNRKVENLEKENEQLKQQITKAKENKVIWHDLRENPKDLPKRYKHANRSPLVITNKGIGHYNFIKKTWYIYNTECNCSFFDTVIAWCELPKFEVEE